MFAIEVYSLGVWVRCVGPEGEARFPSADDAATEARWSLGDTAWRVVEVASRRALSRAF